MSWACDPHLTSTITQGYSTAGPGLLGALQTFLAAQCIITPQLYGETTRTKLNVVAGETYDFVVVGAGTAGAVVANRLSEIGEWKVLLLEAGGNPTLGTEIPQLFINNYGTAEDWNFRTEPQKKACLNYKDKKCYWPRGKVLGGTSSINGMYYIRGNKADYDNWATINEDWNYENVLKYFKKSENLATNANNVDKIYHGIDGYLNVEYDEDVHPIENILLQANNELGNPILVDFNGENQVGVGRVFTTTKNGERQSTVNAFMKPIKDRQNLHVLTNVIVDKIIVENDIAKGVHIKANDNIEIEVFPTKEIILSAGTINSVHILLNSGIGPKDVLENISNILPRVDLPVGKNLQDHIYAPIIFKVKSVDDSNILTNMFKSFYEYITERKGPLANLSPQRVISFINTTDSKSKTPDVQNHFIVVYPNQSNFVDIFGQHRFSDQFYKSFNELNRDHIIVIVYVSAIQPKSKGSIEIDLLTGETLIKANYLNDDDDIKTILRGMKHVLKLEKTEAFTDAGLKLHWIDIDACKHIDKISDDYLTCIIRHLTGTLYHAVGTNKMGKIDDTDAVVDHELKVRNVKNLRVIDASVMPNIVRGNTMAPVIMIAEKGADYIKERWLNA